MAGVGIKLNRIFQKKSIMASFVGFAYSLVVTVVPVLLVIGNILLTGWVLGFGGESYMRRELFSCTVLYIFIFALLSVSPLNAVLSKYVQDTIYEERFENILPCYHLGLGINMVLACGMGIPFCLWEHFVGGVEVFVVFVGYCGYIAMTLVFYSMVYLFICKDYERVSIFFLIGMLMAFLLSLLLHDIFGWGIMESMLFALTVGIFLIAVLEYAAIKRYFPDDSNQYKPVLLYFKKWWKLVLTNFFYILGLYIHNFVFWGSDTRMVLADTFICNQPYDMASCIALFTNISATIIFVSRIEMHFNEKYKLYSEAIIGGKKADIENAKKRMFRQLSDELMNLVRLQFIISVVIYLLCMVLLPQFGFGGLVMRIYPCLAAGYFILFLMYAAILFLYYYNDLTGSMLTAGSFCLVTLIGSIFATHLSEIWYGIGVVLGAFIGWTIAYARLRWVERNLDVNVFCQGQIIKSEMEPRPSGIVYEKKSR
mgnify:CR=1 FL=1